MLEKPSAEPAAADTAAGACALTVPLSALIVSRRDTFYRKTNIAFPSGCDATTAQ